MKIYEKPEVELISLAATEAVTSEVGSGDQEVVSAPNDPNYWD